MRCDDEWVGATGSGGYGRVWFQGRMIAAHRLRFFEVFGWWPKVVRHTCDNPPCRNPMHLVPGTHADNMRDREERGRTYRLNEGMPDQRTCYSAYQQEKRRRQKAGTWIYRQPQEASIS